MSRPLLRSGSRGSEVEELQTLLNERLTPSPRLQTDGIYGPRTTSAVRRFQRANWLSQDGIAGPCTLAALEEREEFVILHQVNLVPQRDRSACWLAATSMLLRQSIPRSAVPSSLMGSSGGLLNDSQLNDAANTQAYARHFNLRMHPPQSWTARSLASVLRSGPVATHILWNVSGYLSGSGSSGHFAVIAGIRGDGTSEGTTLRIYDPWPPNQGKIHSAGYGKLMSGTPALTYQLFQR